VNLAYVDTSCLVAIAFGESGARRVAARLGRFDRVFSSNLLEAELRSALIREGVSGDAARPLLAGIAATGYVRGADLWHLACALFLEPDGRDLVFLTLDRRQAEVAARLHLSS
jgi:hypothetical protein